MNGDSAAREVVASKRPVTSRTPHAAQTTPAMTVASRGGGVLAVRGVPVDTLVRGPSVRFDRTYYTQRDYKGVDAAAAEALSVDLRARAPGWPGGRAD